MLTGRGRALLAGGAASYGAGLVSGYDQLLVLGAAALAAVGLGAAWVLRRHGLDVDREVAPDRVTRSPRRTDDQPDGRSDRRSPVRALLSVRNRRRGRSPAAQAVELVNGEPRPVAVLRLEGRGHKEFSYPLPNDQRGVFDIGPVEITRADPLTAWRTVQRAGRVHRLWVHPRQHELNLRAGQAPSLDGDMGDQASDGSVTFHALREYVPGDDLRLVHWRSYARTGELLVRVNVDTGIAQTTILVDTRRAVYRASAPDEEGDDGFEAAMEIAASMAVAAAHAGEVARLVTTCGTTTTGGIVGHAPTAILDALAGLQRSPERALPDRLARLATDRANDVLLAVTGLASSDDLTTLGALTRLFRRSSIVVVGDGADRHPVPPRLAGKVLRAASGEEFAHLWNLAVSR